MSTLFQLKRWGTEQVHSPYLQQPLLTRFLNWADNQQFDRLLWLGIAFMFHGCVLTPITVMVALTANSGFWVIGGAIFSILIIVITGLAALPTKITIPIFFLSIALDIILIAYSLIQAIHSL
jgi:hypothetical protein